MGSFIVTRDLAMSRIDLFMLQIFSCFFGSILDLFHPKMLLLLLLPPLIALLIWGGLGYLFWEQLLTFSHGFSERFLFTQEIPAWMIEWFSVTPQSVATALAGI